MRNQKLGSELHRHHQQEPEQMTKQRTVPVAGVSDTKELLITRCIELNTTTGRDDPWQPSMSLPSPLFFTIGMAELQLAPTLPYI